MEKLKTLLPILLGIFIVVGGLITFSLQEAEARRGGNCVYDPVEYDCYDTSQFNCDCIVVTPPKEVE